MIKYDKLDSNNIVTYLNDILRSKILTYNISSLILSNSSTNLILHIYVTPILLLYMYVYDVTSYLCFLYRRTPQPVDTCR